MGSTQPESGSGPELTVGNPRFIPLVRMRERLRVDFQDSEAAYYKALMYCGEFLVKANRGPVGKSFDKLSDDHQYRREYNLVNADGIGVMGRRA